MALFLAELLAFVKFNFLSAQVLQHVLLHREPFVFFFVLCLARDVLGLEFSLCLFSLNFLAVRHVHLLLQSAGFLSQSVYLGTYISELGPRLVEPNSKLIENFV